MYCIPFLISLVAIQAVKCAPYVFNNIGPLSTYKSVSQVLSCPAGADHLRGTETGYICTISQHKSEQRSIGHAWLHFLEPFQMTQAGPYLYDNAGVDLWLIKSRILD
jgi:hypothetical protein